MSKTNHRDGTVKDSKSRKKEKYPSRLAAGRGGRPLTDSSGAINSGNAVQQKDHFKTRTRFHENAETKRLAHSYDE